MAKPEWGIKRSCQSCGCKFYDMKRDPINCPSCGAQFDPEALLKTRRSSRSAPAPKAAPKVVPTPAADGDDNLLESDDDLEDVEDVADGDDENLLVEDDMDDDNLGDVVVAKEDEEES